MYPCPVNQVRNIDCSSYEGGLVFISWGLGLRRVKSGPD